MTDALTRVAYRNKLDIREFAVVGTKTATDNFKHVWYSGCDQPIGRSKSLREELDYELSMLNTDYLIDRHFALEEIELNILPNKVFYDFMKIKNKYGAQHKFPRVLKGQMALDWVKYLQYIEEDSYAR